MAVTFQCPQCRALLAIQEDGVACPNHGTFSYDSHGFYAFFPAGDDYFTHHWSAHKTPVLPPAKLAAAERFLAPLAAAANQGTVLDIGTGDGVHLFVLHQQRPEMAILGLDISPSALATAHRRVPAATLMLADAQAIPLPDNAVDATFSFGVLAYVPSPWRGLAEMVRVTRPGGMIGVWMYPRTSSVLGRLFAFTRAVVPKLPRFLQARVADAIVPLLPFLPTAGGLHLGNASWAACREVVLVNIAPPHLVFPTHEELRQQLTTLGCRVVHEDTAQPLTFWAVKE